MPWRVVTCRDGRTYTDWKDPLPIVPSPVLNSPLKNGLHSNLLISRAADYPDRRESAVTTYSALDLDLFSRGIAVEPCCAPSFKRTCSAIAVLEKLEVGHLAPLEARQHAQRRCDFLPSPVRFVIKRAEKGDATTLLNGVSDPEIERRPEALDCRKNLG